MAQNNPAHSLKLYLNSFQRWLREYNLIFGDSGTLLSSKKITTALDNRSKELTAKGNGFGAHSSVIYR